MKYRYFRPFWPRKAFGTCRHPGPGLKTEKRNFLAIGVPKSKKKLPQYLGWLSATFSRFTLCPTGLPWAGNRKTLAWYFRPFWPRTAFGTGGNPGPRADIETMQFPGARGTFGGEIRTPQKFLTESAQLFYTLRFGRPGPHG